MSSERKKAYPLKSRMAIMPGVQKLLDKKAISEDILRRMAATVVNEFLEDGDGYALGQFEAEQAKLFICIVDPDDKFPRVMAFTMSDLAAMPERVRQGFHEQIALMQAGFL